MPKKKDKKSGDKQAEVKKTSKKESSSSPADQTRSEDKDKDFYLTQMRYLNERLERYELKCDEQERQKKDLSCQYSALQEEKKDITDYLKRSLLEKEDEVDELKEQLDSQRQAADKDREVLQLQHGQLRRELQERIQEVNTENKILAARLGRLEEFEKQREQLMSNVESLKKQLVSQEEEHKDAIHNLEMKALLEKKRLEGEMESHVAAMAAELQHLVDQKVPETSRLALQENVEVKAQIKQLSEQTQLLMKENSALRDRKVQLTLDVTMLEQMLSETSRKSCIHQRVVEQLTQKCRQLQVELTDWRQECEQLQTKQDGVVAELEALRQDRDSLSWQGRKHTGEVSRLQAELQEERRRSSRMESITQEAAVTLREALMDMPTHQDWRGNSAIQWRQLMEKLLVVLDRPKPKSPAENHQLDEQLASDSAADRAVTLNPALSFQFELARYRPGDLGLVPRPRLKHRHPPCRPGAAGPSSTHTPLHRNLSSQKTATNRTDPAVRLLTATTTKPK